MGRDCRVDVSVELHAADWFFASLSRLCMFALLKELCKADCTSPASSLTLELWLELCRV